MTKFNNAHHRNDNKLDLNKRLAEKFNKCNKIIGIVKKLSLLVLRQISLIIYTSFVRANVDYVDIFYDKPHKACFIEKIAWVWYNVGLAFTGAFKGTSRGRLYQELRLELLNLCHLKEDVIENYVSFSKLWK